MGLIAEMMKKAEADGYTGANAPAKVCQDIVLKGIAESSLNRNVTIKGGVVMNYLLVCLTEFIIDDPGMRQNRISDMVTRLEKTFNNRMYVSRIQTSEKTGLKSTQK